MLPIAIVTISMALVFYSIGVWSEKIQGVLKRWHIVVFWIGLVFDTTGTTFMSRIAENNSGRFNSNFHGITGLIAILLMLFHALWAIVVTVKNNEKSKANFHKFSILVWFIWLLPFLSGMIFGMAK